MSADYDCLIHSANQLIATKIAMLHTLAVLQQKLEKRLDDSEARIIRTRQLLAVSATLIQHSKLPHEQLLTPM